MMFLYEFDRIRKTLCHDHDRRTTDHALSTSTDLSSLTSLIWSTVIKTTLDRGDFVSPNTIDGGDISLTRSV